MGAALEVEVPADDALVEEYQQTVLFLLGVPPLGYLWIFPKAEHLSVGIGTFLGKNSAMREILRREMARLGVDVEGHPEHGHPLPIYLRRERLHQGRVLLAGDAGGLVDPLLGEGIRHAIDSGRMAAEAVLREDPAGYTARVQRTLGTNLRWGLRLARVFYYHPEASFELGVRNPRFLTLFLRLFAGQTTYRRMALCAPFDILLGLPRRRPAVQPRDLNGP
jgi:flavin-dependent dehydrogenase